MADPQMVFKLSKKALALIKQGKAELTPGGIRDLKTKKIIELVKPQPMNAVSQKQQMMAMANSLGSTQAAAWINVALNLVNLGVSVAGFYFTLTKMEALHGEIHDFISRFNALQDAEQFERYKTHLLNMTSHLNFLQNRYTMDEYDKSMFIIRETDIEAECNATASFLEKTLKQYQKHEITEELACQILFTLAPVYAQLVNEYCCQYFCTHRCAHQQFSAWKNVLDQIGSESFYAFMKKEMAFNVKYADLSPQRRAEIVRISFDCIRQLIRNLDVSAEMIQTVPEGELIQVDELLSAWDWNDIRSRIKTEADETPEEYISHQLKQIEIQDDGEEEIYFSMQMAYA